MSLNTHFTGQCLLLVTLLVSPSSGFAKPNDSRDLPMAKKKGNPVLVGVADPAGNVSGRGLATVIEVDGKYYLVGNREIFRDVKGMAGNPAGGANGTLAVL